jgi:hypothetical protein
MTNATEITGSPKAGFKAHVIATRGGWTNDTYLREESRCFIGTVNEVRADLALEDDGATWNIKAV